MFYIGKSLRWTKPGTKGCAFRISLNPLCAVHSGGALRPFPSREGPRPDGINHSSFFHLNLIVQFNGFRADRDVSAKTCEKVPAGRFSVRSANSDRNAHIMDAPTDSRKISASSRIYRDSNPHAARTIRSKIIRVVSVMCGFSSFRTGH